MNAILDGIPELRTFFARPEGMQGFETVLWEAADGARLAAYRRLDGEGADSHSYAGLDFMAREDAKAIAYQRLARLIRHPVVLDLLAEALALEGVDLTRKMLAERQAKAMGASQ